MVYAQLIDLGELYVLYMKTGSNLIMCALLMFEELISVGEADFTNKFEAYCGNYLSKIQ
jgi:hypothetical protein